MIQRMCSFVFPKVVDYCFVVVSECLRDSGEFPNCSVKIYVLYGCTENKLYF